ncbi:MAG: hypothetical protein KDC83_12915 [Flavobacteriales bacterium]|nr:hypothetical protein [Flavobacteriales bacterium]
MSLAKSLFLIPFILLSNGCISQQIQKENISVEQSGNKNELSKEEVELLNALLANSRDTFSFENKKIAFITGSSGSKVLAKADFFDTCIHPWIKEDKKPQIFMVQLSEKEKDQSGGYDAFVLSWVKVFTKRQKRKVIELIGRNSS